jgi:hypothetical protein
MTPRGLPSLRQVITPDLELTKQQLHCARGSHTAPSSSSNQTLASSRLLRMGFAGDIANTLSREPTPTLLDQVAPM